MSLFNKMLASNKYFYNKLNQRTSESSGTLLFDIFFDESPIIYGIAKTALAISKSKDLLPLGIVPQKLSTDNEKIVNSMCFETTGKRFFLFYVFIRNFIKIAKLFIKIKDRKSLLVLNVDSINIGKHIYDGILRSNAIPTINIISLKMKLRILTELVYFFTFSYLIDKRNIKFIVCSDNVYRCGLLFELAKSKSIPCVSPINLNGFSMTYNSSIEDYNKHCRSAEREVIKIINQEKADLALKSYFIDRYSANIEQHDVLAAYSSDKSILTRSHLNDQYKLDPTLPIIVVMAHIFADAPHAYPNTLYDDYYEWFIQTIDILNENPCINLLVKEHPSAMLYNEEGLVFEILARRGIEGKLIENNIHTLTVLKEMDVVVTCGGTIGQEFSYMKKPVVLAAT
ncbi:hypothetical protein OAD64_01120, partial [Oceanospirillaceae bacterium]|nr:hypothetical protein [Oceanospirillaceae bacterium]